MTVDLAGQIDECERVRGGASLTLTARLLKLRRSLPLASKGFLSIVDQAVVSGTSFATAAIIGRATFPDQLGLYYLLLTVVLVVLGIQDQVVALPYSVYSKRRQGIDLAEYAGSMWVHHAALTVLSAAGIAVAIVVTEAFDTSDIVPGLWVLLGAVPLFLLREGVRRFLFANLQVRTAITIDVAVAIMQLSGLCLLAYFDMLTLLSAYGVMAGAGAWACLGWYVLDAKPVRFSQRRVLPDFWQNWAMSKWAVGNYLVGNIAPFLMIWILSFVADNAAAGLLGACATLIGVSNIIVIGMANVLTPQAAHAFAVHGTSELRRVLIRTALPLTLALGAHCLLFVVAGNALASFVYGPLYDGCRPILVALAASTIFVGINTVSGNGLWAIDRPRANFVADVCGMSVSLITAAFFVVPFGALGAALATLMGTSSSALVRTFALVRAMNAFELSADLGLPVASTS
jgi:O-antigen/teichoic acid export membrane protein